MKRVLIASLVVALSLTACATETTTEGVVATTEPTVEIVETIKVTEPVVETEPTIEVTEPIVEEPVVEYQPTEPIVEVEVEVEEVTEPVEVVEPTEPEVEEETETNEYLGEFKLTAYCACSYCCGKSDGITASGTVATQGRTIAVDPSVIPYGTEVVINGNTYVAEDCGGAIKSNKIDIYFDSHSEALAFGVQYADVYIKE